MTACMILMYYVGIYDSIYVAIAVVIMQLFKIFINNNNNVYGYTSIHTVYV